MKNITISRTNHPTPSQIYIGDVLPLLSELTRSRRTVIISQQPIVELWGASFPPCDTIIIEGGEAHKTLTTVEEIHRQLLALGADRHTFLVGFGGGIVTDITGFVASTYMRGVDFGFVATTLLAQVDASVGGKNGVNLDGYKNMVGTFNQPQWVLCDTSVLTTLPHQELLAGYAEAIKCGLLCDIQLVEMFESGNFTLEDVVERSVRIKAAIVEQDERESGVRKMLNLGHTFAHAIEKCSDGAYLHGHAVAIGLCRAAELSAQRGLISQADYQRVVRCVATVGLPTECPEIDEQQLQKAMLTDKKNHDGQIEYVLLNNIGHNINL